VNLGDQRMAIEEFPLDQAVLADDPDKYFKTEHLRADLGSRTARGGVVTIVSQALRFVLSMVGTVILARLLTPQDYGLIGMVAVVTGFISIYKDLGLASATIQRPTITAAQISTLFWINVALSLVVTFVCILVAPVLSWFYGESKLIWITIASAFGFTLSGLAVQHEALLRRQMRFVVISLISVLAMVTGYAVGILLAWNGYQYRALVFSQLTLVATNTIGIFFVCRWRPGLPQRNTGVSSMIKFGGNFTGFSTINYFSRNLDNLLIGKVWGPFQLGLYNRAYQLMMLPIDQINEPITSVAVPALSRLIDSPDAYRRAYLRIIEKIALITMPGVMLMIVTNDLIVSVMLGPKWHDVGPLLVVLGISGLVQPIGNTTGWLFITQARTQRMFKLGMITGPITVVSILLGLHWGAIGVAIAYVCIRLSISDPLVYWFVGRKGPVRTKDFYVTMAPIAGASLAGGLACVAFRIWVNPANRLVGLASCGAIMAVGTLLVLGLLPAGRRTLADLLKTFHLLRQKGEQ